MRLIVLGQDENGRSCIVEQGEPDGQAIHGPNGPTIAELFLMTQSPPPAVPKADSKFRSGGLEPGHLRWYLIDHKPREPDPENTPPPEVHWRDTIDLLFMIKGSADLTLGDGVHPIVAGDFIVMNGTEHALRAGPDGCQMVSLAIGTNT